jgi:hypothetical protein
MIANEPTPLNGNELIERFEANPTSEASFHHADHVRLAFAYLCEFPVLTALEKFSSALKRFAAARGKPQLYHEPGARQGVILFLAY